MNDNRINPWNGLRTYVEGEIIYGRSEEIQTLSMLILQNHQTVVYGRSGIGKSSILNAGIFPIARKQGVFPVYIRLEHNAGVSYLQQIKDAIVREIDRLGGDITIAKLADKSVDETLWEFFHRIEYRDRQGRLVRPLIVFDQFEEIFTLELDKKKVDVFFRQLADLINNVMPDKLSDMASVSACNTGQNEPESGSLDLGLGVFSDITYSYKSDSDYHLVFILREDFLSYLERNTVDIPALKNNRYCLQPINEEQAAEIIMQPRAGLVDVSVAKLIIEKVTGERNFEIDGVPEIQVDSSILSLYLSRLYDKMIELGQEEISVGLVETYSENIIEDFYVDSIEGLSEKSIQWLENTLVNEDGRRDNRDLHTVLRESGLTLSRLKELVDGKKLLRQFSYGGNLRIEFIHDVLCQVILKHRQARLEQQHLQELQARAKREKRNLMIKTTAIASVIIVIIILASFWMIENNKTIKIVDLQQNLVLSLEETPTVKNVDFWRADLEVVGRYGSGRDTVLLSRSINKSEISTPMTINTDSCSSILFSLDFGDFTDIGKYENQLVEIPVSEIMESPYVKLPVNRNIPFLFPYAGRIMLDVKNVDIPLKNAIVMIGDDVAVTDSAGYFEMSLESLPDDDTSILIAKGGLGCYEMPVTGNGNRDNTYHIQPVDSLMGFYKKVLEVDSVARWNYSTVGTEYCANKDSRNGLYVKYEDGHDDRLMMFWKKGETLNDRIMLTGYFFFKTDWERMDSVGSGCLAYYIGSGCIDCKFKKDENKNTYRNFEFKGYDAAANQMTVTGKYYTVKGAGKYRGELTSNRRLVASFGMIE